MLELAQKILIGACEDPANNTLDLLPGVTVARVLEFLGAAETTEFVVVLAGEPTEDRTLHEIRLYHNVRIVAKILFSPSSEGYSVPRMALIRVVGVLWN